MAPRCKHGSTLSIHRAFVVHLSAKGGSRRHRFAGRVEHLSSDRSALFSALRGLLAFFGATLDASGHTASPGTGDSLGTDLPKICRTLRPPRESPNSGAAAPRRRRVMIRALGVLPRPRRPRHHQAGKTPAQRRDR
jgi:hypothetical protein